MSFTKQIEPIKILDKTAITLSTYVINYDGSNCVLYWWISDEKDNMVINGNYNVPSDIIKEWSVDDEVLIKSLAEYNRFSIIN